MAEIWETQETGEGEEGVERRARSIRYQVAIDPLTESDADAHALVAATRPAVYPGTTLGFVSTRLRPIEAGVFSAECEYSSKQTDREKEEGEGSISYSTVGGSARVYYSRSTVGRYGPQGAQGPDYDGAIGVTDNGIEGVDIAVTMPKMTVSIMFGTTYITESRLDRWEKWASSVNKNDWDFTYNARRRRFKAREALFLGFTFDDKLGASKQEVKFDFAIVRTVTNLVVGKGVLGSLQVNGQWVIPEKKGHDYLWVRGVRRTDPATGTVIEVPRSANVEQVYSAENDFNLIWG